jgi:small conductance mechanosensitive channel
MENLIEQTSEFIFLYGIKVLGALATLVIGFWIIGHINKVVRNIMAKRNWDPTVRPFLGSLISIGLKILLLLSVAGMFGIPTTSFIAVFSALAFAVGFSLQGNLGNFASGVLILIFKPYRVGDFISVQSFSGVVKEIQIFNTLLQALDNRIIIIPNGAITSGPIENLTTQGERRHDLTFGIGYKDDIDKAKAALEKVLRSTPGALLDKEYQIFVRALNNSSVDFAVRFWAKNEDFWSAFFHINEAVKKEFDRQGIGIPYPQMDVHLHNHQ